METWLIRGARVTDPSQKRENEPLDVLIRDGVVAELGPSLSADAREIRADGLDLLPGPGGYTRASAGSWADA